MAASVGAPGNLHVVGIMKQMALGVPSIDDQVVGLVIAIGYIFESKRIRIVPLEYFLIIRVKNYLGDGKSVVTRGGGLHVIGRVTVAFLLGNRSPLQHF